ncbi:MAG: hypothetical protein GYA41_04655 [Bacteroidales bacterium]|nr:hypothetical protein [Bacteroidales bacterium]
MNKSILVFVASILITASMTAQNSDRITVKAGTLVKSCFPPSVRYRYPEFIAGLGIMKNGAVIKDRFNYNFLLGEMEFIRSSDTLVLSNKKDLKLITLGRDTFYYFNGYLELIRSDKPRVFARQLIVLKDVEKKGAMGTTARNTSIDSYNSVATGGRIYELRPQEDWVFQKTSEYYLSSSDKPYVMFLRKNAIQAVPGKEDDIKEFIKSEKIKFESREDLLKLAGYLGSLQRSNP